MLNSLYNQLIVLLSKWRDTIISMNEEPTPQPIEPTTVVSSPSRFLEFCGLIKNNEGANPANNNPYNDRFYYGEYLPKYGTVKESSGGFAIFETLVQGEEYGETIIRQLILKHPEWDFLDFFAVYAPLKDHNDPVGYAKKIAAEMKVAVTANLKSILNF